MIVDKKIRDFTVYIKDNNKIYEDIFIDFLNNNLNVIKIFRNIEDTKVSLIQTPYGKYVLKIFAPKEKKTERFLKSLIKGDYYHNLLMQTDRIRNEGILFPNDFYLLAEKKIFNYASVFIMIIEYVEGIELIDLYAAGKVDQNILTDIKNKIEILHKHNMVSGDPHEGNFILSNNGIRLIDLSGKKCTVKLKAKDRIDLERHLGIKNEIRDYGYYSLVIRKKIRALIHKIKGKKKRER